MGRSFLLVLCLTTFVGCNSILDKKYSDKTLDADGKALLAEIDTTETTLILGTIIRYKFQNKNLETLTYGELLEDGKAFKAEQDKIESEQQALAEKAIREEQERARRLNESLAVTVFDKGFIKLDYEEFITYKFAFQNKTSREILAFTGTMVFNDLFDKEIKKLSLTYDDGIKPNATVNWEATTDYNQFIDSDEALRNKDLGKIKFVWIPEKIMFKDGTILK